MKKIIIIAAVACAVQISAFAQGAFTFATSTPLIWDNTGTAQLAGTAGTYNIAFFYSDNLAATFLAPTVQTNGNSQTVTLIQWNSMLSNPNFVLASNSTPALITSPNTGGLAKGKFAGGTVLATGTPGNTLDSVNGGTVEVVVVAWSGSFSSPTTLGWSSAFTYSYGNQIATPGNFSAAGMTGFGIGTVSAVPEPSTMALAALGGASLLLFRRRK